MSSLPISLLTASFLGLLYVLLSLNVVRYRFSLGISMGDDGNKDLQRAIRAHGNFAEYVPLFLIILLLIEWHGAPSWAVLAGAGLQVAGRILHGYGMTRPNEVNSARKIGVVLTWISFIFFCGLGVGLYLSNVL